MSNSYRTPGVYREDVVPVRAVALPTGVPAFLGHATAGPLGEPVRLTLPGQLAERFGAPPEGGYLAAAVDGFFGNGGRECFVVRLDAPVGGESGDGGETLAKAYEGALRALEALQEIDLVCAPDLWAAFQADQPWQLEERLRLQAAILEHCHGLGDRFALLDAFPGGDAGRVLGDQRDSLPAEAGANGALYFPWLRPLGSARLVPPCGHVAGVVARSDNRVGVHKAPANEALEGVVDLAVDLTDAEQGPLNQAGVNALRAFPGRGLRVWGARTLSPAPAWMYINVRRIFLTAARWIERNLSDAAFEPNDPRLWNRISRELNTYFEGLFRAGALKGRTPAEAFFVKCDGEVNPPEVREAGQVVTVIGLAPALPNEFVVVRIIHGATGASVTGIADIAGPATA
ncbi:MAG TPA: phage tail sheath subtilisin-like domain-containing protein [Thermoanaerobaculia bacterium]|nr:phage tail sheath subtilisin-like domain-containing protein [Thermoanaerobaculia bacterium]